MAFLAATKRQIPDQSIMDKFNRQIYLGNNYSVTRGFTVGTSETPLILLNNTNTTLALFQNLAMVSATTASNSVQVNVYLNPTVTVAGTALTPQNLRGSYGNNSLATVTYSPTISVNGVLVDVLSAAALSNGMSNLLKILDNGQKLLLTSVASSASTNVTAILQWFEL